MRTYIALFRGINVGGKNRLPMKDLAATLENVGCQDVATYIQSGNAVFRSEEADASLLWQNRGRDQGAPRFRAQGAGAGI